jgi:hypothetical protein
MIIGVILEWKIHKFIAVSFYNKGFFAACVKIQFLMLQDSFSQVFTHADKGIDNRARQLTTPEAR